MKTLIQQYEELELKVSKRYDELVKQIGGANFYDVATEDFDEDINDCEVITFVNRSGDNVNAKVLKIEKANGIYIAKNDDDSKRFWIGLNDLSSLYDKITIVELLEGLL